jgi:nucleotide-binding universal stress UspA family protein
MTEPTRRVVAGVDGSAGSRRALCRAALEALAHGATLEVVMAWSLFDQPGDGSFDPHYDAGRARDALHRIVDDEVTPPQPDTVLQVVNDLPARALLEAGEGAWMLVVGSRGLGGFQGLLLGSVSQQVVHHAACPVLVVPEPRPG